MAAARLSADFQQRGDRVTYHPARLHRSAGSTSAEPLLSKGSGDLRTLAAADGLIRFDSGTRLFKAGETVEIVTLD
jgi:molybdopterin biosynthesis enzyme